ncbi:MAG: CRISPR-associated endonuclease Cas1 [Polyangiaceae bacterium]|nr:CRISPR-associated endonuclease Cas1 [Polyangiaceae bacterium]
MPNVPPLPERPAISLQMLAGAAERIQRRLPGSLDQDDLAQLVEHARERLAEMPFIAEPLRGLRVRGKAKSRITGVPTPVERVIEEALRPRLEQTLEALLPDPVHGYRRGRSALTASQALRDHLAAGRTKVATTDVEAFFPSVSHAQILELAGAAWPDLADILRAFVTAPILLDGRLLPHAGGLPLGRAISPYLSNLVLLSVDRRMLAEHGDDLGYVRYADDLVLAAEDPGSLDRALGTLDAALAELGLQRSAPKTHFIDASVGPVSHLGHFVDASNVFVRKVDQPAGGRKGPATTPSTLVAASTDAEERAPAFRRSQTLYVTTNGCYIAVNNASVVVRHHQEVLATVPLHRLDRIIILAHVGMSSGFASACIARRIPVTFVVGKGRAFGSLSSGSLPNPLRLRAQYDLVAQREARVELARAIVAAKIDAMLRRLKNVTMASEIRADLAAYRANLTDHASPESLRGVEGVATKRYFEGFAARISQEAFAFRGRSRRPPRDPINSLLSFAYTLVFSWTRTQRSCATCTATTPRWLQTSWSPTESWWPTPSCSPSSISAASQQKGSRPTHPARSSWTTPRDTACSRRLSRSWWPRWGAPVAARRRDA